ncbi:MAG: hypothetical protein QM802_01365 [Agriterribacter sp.]
MKIAYITYSGIAKYLPANNFNEVEDLLPLLTKKGFDITAEIWDDPKVDWSKYDVALLKTPWDYHQKYEQFKQWLNRIEAADVRLLNDFTTVRWNMDKHYLAEIAQAGFDVIPTLYIERGWTGELLPIFEQLQSTELIIKPCVSGGSKNTIVIQKDSSFEQRAKVIALLSEADYLVQPLMHEVQNGEWSFVFFNGRYSHTILKKPKAGDFRVQQIHGGTITTIYASQRDIDNAATYLQQFANNIFYARVDGLMVNGKFMLMELELIEPFLYLSYGEGAVERYCEALEEQLGRMR